MKKTGSRTARPKVTKKPVLPEQSTQPLPIGGMNEPGIRKAKDGGVMVGGAKRPMGMYRGGSTMGTKGTARGMGAAVKGGKFTDL